MIDCWSTCIMIGSIATKYTDIVNLDSTNYECDLFGPACSQINRRARVSSKGCTTEIRNYCIIPSSASSCLGKTVCWVREKNYETNIHTEMQVTWQSITANLSENFTTTKSDVGVHRDVNYKLNTKKESWHKKLPGKTSFYSLQAKGVLLVKGVYPL